MVSGSGTSGTPSAETVAFRRWFSFLAESRYYARKTAAEVPDGEALVRWAWRNALVEHDAAWQRRVELPVYPAMRAVRASAGVVGDLPPRQFISRDLADLQPGDLLMYGRAGTAANVMVFVGASQIVPSAGTWVVYLAGPPRDGLALRVHRLRLENLVSDPYPGWRPVAENREFLGIWRLSPELVQGQ